MTAKTGLKEELAKKAEGMKEGDATEKEAPARKMPPAKNMPETCGGNDAIRLLRADEIECRVSVINENGLSLLLFKDARVDQKILDETFTPFGWRRTHQSIDGNLYCTVEVWDEGKEQWIAKQDVGTESYSEKEKGQASDSFKRACFNWGIGRELYTAPFIWVPAELVKIEKRGERFLTKDRFKVQEVAYNPQREISALSIVNGRGQVVYSLKAKPKLQNITEMQRAALERELERTGVTLEAVLGRYNLKELGQMTPEVFTKALSGLKRTKSRDAA